MKSIEPISGTWNGEYSYDSEDYSENSIRFKMTLSEESGEITGHCIDSEEDGGIPIPAGISGFIEGSSLSFIKQYPFLVYIDENGCWHKDETQAHPEIHYFGEIENGILKGTWEINIESFNHGMEIVVEQITGTWEMNKE